MKTEQLSPTAIKITLTAEESVALPPSKDKQALSLFIRSLAAQVRHDKNISLPSGRMLAEIYAISDGSSVIFLSVIYPVENDRMYACELNGIEKLRGIAKALCGSGVRCSVYCGAEPQCYRILFSEPPSELRHICCEYGEYCEISRLFAAQTAEYLTAIAENCSADTLCELLG